MHMNSSVLIFLLLVGVFCLGKQRPILLLHGIDIGSESLDHMKELIERECGYIYVRNENLGGRWTSFRPVPEQVESLCDVIKNDSELNSELGLNILGVSQGGLICRGAVEFCDANFHTFVSWVSPQAGVYGIPHFQSMCMKYLKNSSLCLVPEEMVSDVVYSKLMQESLSVAGYWRDPFKWKEFEEKSCFLSVFNNDVKRNEKFRENMIRLKNLLIIHSEVDSVIPRDSSDWAFYEDGNAKRVVPLRESELYNSDRIGLKTLDEGKRLHMFNTTCLHEDYSSQCFDEYFSRFVIPYICDQK